MSQLKSKLTEKTAKISDLDESVAKKGLEVIGIAKEMENLKELSASQSRNLEQKLEEKEEDISGLQTIINKK